MTNATDITDLSDAALDVFISVKAGEDVATGHLTDAERPVFVGADIESMILDRQLAEIDGHE